MTIEYLCKNYDPSDKLKAIIDKKVQKLDKFFEDDTRINIMLKKGNTRSSNDLYTLELTVLLNGVVLRAEVTSDNMYSNIDFAIPKLEKQIIRHHKKIESKSKKFRIKDLVPIEEVEAEEQVERSRQTFSFTAKSIRTAVRQVLTEIALAARETPPNSADCPYYIAFGE